ncbi:MAG: GyrI-like domain-containing protein, partial [Kiritimatiellaeota bacterium]|nr:GyrI-like domain-containing protein [Kiritimatiellota bacterium]
SVSLVNFEIIEQPEILIVGKLLRFNFDWSKPENTPPALWQRSFADGTFTTLEALTNFIHNPSYVGYMDNYDPADNAFDYICGMMMKPGTPVPDGFISRTVPAAKVANGWIKGKQNAEREIYDNAHTLTDKALAEHGLKYAPGANWSMEVYTCPRFTTPDADGFIILDYYLPCE